MGLPMIELGPNAMSGKHKAGFFVKLLAMSRRTGHKYYTHLYPPVGIDGPALSSIER
jgi:hypothetical protein